MATVKKQLLRPIQLGETIRCNLKFVGGSIVPNQVSLFIEKGGEDFVVYCWKNILEASGVEPGDSIEILTAMNGNYQNVTAIASHSS